jgi:hypothetical protein
VILRKRQLEESSTASLGHLKLSEGGRPRPLAHDAPELNPLGLTQQHATRVIRTMPHTPEATGPIQPRRHDVLTLLLAESVREIASTIGTGDLHTSANTPMLFVI